MFDLIRRVPCEPAPEGREVRHFRGLAKHWRCGVLGLRGLLACATSFRTTLRLVSTTFSRGNDDHHGDLFLFTGGEIYF